MEPVKDSLLDLERYRRNLELEITGLRRGLQNWQTWDAEYEALKEEIEAADEGRYEKIQNEFDGELVKRKEVDEVIGEQGKRTKDQMINVLNHRIDYVTRNIASLTKELQRAENKYATASVISQPDEVQDEEGQPMTEIMEELDEDDNVISYKLNRPAHNMGHVVDTLRKAGIKNVPEVEQGTPIKMPSAQGPDDPEPPIGYLPNKRTSEEFDMDKMQDAIFKMPPKKEVSFTEDTKPEEAEPSMSRNAVRVENIMKAARDQSINNPIIPDDEDEEDAALRQELLRYSMNEVGAVVGELELDDGSDDEDWDMSDEGFDEEQSDEEDQYGRNGRVVTEDYAQRMLELEKKLGIQSRFTQDSRAAAEGDADSDSDDERVGRIVVDHNSESSSQPSAMKMLPSRPKEKHASAGKEKNKKKGVRFAESLDVSEAPEPSAATVTEPEPKVEPMSDLIVERDPSTRNSNTKPDRKPSRFKKAQTKAPVFAEDIDDNPYSPNYGMPMSSAPSTNDPDPPDKTLSDTLVERDYVTIPMSDLMELDAEDGFLDDVNYQELASEHQELRRKFIQREGGFLKQDENPIQSLDEEEGGPKRQSRFKAARLSRQ